MYDALVEIKIGDGWGARRGVYSDWADLLDKTAALAETQPDKQLRATVFGKVVYEGRAANLPPSEPGSFKVRVPFTQSSRFEVAGLGDAMAKASQLAAEHGDIPIVGPDDEDKRVWQKRVTVTRVRP